MSKLKEALKSVKVKLFLRHLVKGYKIHEYNVKTFEYIFKLQRLIEAAGI